MKCKHTLCTSATSIKYCF